MKETSDVMQLQIYISNFESTNNLDYGLVENWKVRDSKQFLNKFKVCSFRSFRISGGTLNPPDRPNSINLDDEKYMDANIFESTLNTLKLLYRLIKFEFRMFYHHKSLFLFKKDSGNCGLRKITLFGKILSDASIRNSYYFAIFKKYFSECKVILEIGGGYGHLASLISKNSDTTYYLCDLPQNLILAAEFLRQEKITFSVFNNDTVNHRGIILILPPDIESLSPNLIINTMSFQHMSPAYISYYLKIINESQPNYLYLVNRNIKRDETDTIIDEYPISNIFKKIKISSIQTKNHKEIIYALQKKIKD